MLAPHDPMSGRVMMSYIQYLSDTECHVWEQLFISGTPGPIGLSHALWAKFHVTHDYGMWWAKDAMWKQAGEVRTEGLHMEAFEQLAVPDEVACPHSAPPHPTSCHTSYTPPSLILYHLMPPLTPSYHTFPLYIFPFIQFDSFSNSRSPTSFTA